MNEILAEIAFLEQLSSELTTLTIKLGKINALVTERAVKSMEEVKEFEKQLNQLEVEEDKWLVLVYLMTKDC